MIISEVPHDQVLVSERRNSSDIVPIDLYLEDCPVLSVHLGIFVGDCFPSEVKVRHVKTFRQLVGGIKVDF